MFSVIDYCGVAVQMKLLASYEKCITEYDRISHMKTVRRFVVGCSVNGYGMYNLCLDAVIMTVNRKLCYA